MRPHLPLRYQESTLELEFRGKTTGESDKIL
jgi:hypothetical protein